MTWLHPCFMLSPSLAIASYLKHRRILISATRLCCWNTVFHLLAAIFVTTTVFAHCRHFNLPTWTYWLFAVLALSRINELVLAFYGDALDRVNHETPRLALKPSQRVNLLGVGYLETLVQFGILHLAIQSIVSPTAYNQPFLDSLDSIYFSGITLTTTGYGDLYPVHTAARYLTLYEAIIGIVFLALALSVYLSIERSRENKH